MGPYRTPRRSRRPATSPRSRPGSASSCTTRASRWIPGRCERFARAVTLVRPRSQRELYACGLATLVSGPEQIEIYDRVFAVAFGISLERAVPVSGAVMAAEPGPRGDAPPAAGAGCHPRPAERPARRAARRAGPPAPPDELGGDMPWRTLASDAERLADRDFADLSAAELLQLEAMMRERALATPPRRTRRYRPRAAGSRPDLRMTLRQARRTAGEPVQLARRAPRLRPRRLVVLCDISGSMEPYARAMLQLLYCASQGKAAHRGAGRGEHRPGPRRGVHVRHPAHPDHRRTGRRPPGNRAGAGGRGRPGLVRRHPYRRVPQGVQRRVRLPGPGPWRRRPDHLRRLGNR